MICFKVKDKLGIHIKEIPILPSEGLRDYSVFFAAIMKWGKTTTHIQQRRQSTVTSWQW